MAETSLTFYRGTAADDRAFYALAYFDDLEAPDEPFPRVRLIRFDREREAWDDLSTQEWVGAALALGPGPTDPTLAVLGKAGDVLVGTPGAFDSQVLDPGRTLRMNDIAATASGFVAVGAGSTLYLRDGSGPWEVALAGVTFETLAERLQAIGNGDDYPTTEAYMAALQDATRGFETFLAAEGGPSDEVLVTGERGRLVHRGADGWQSLDSGTRANLASVSAAGDGWLACGFAPSTVVIHVEAGTGQVRTLFEDNERRTLTSVARWGDRTFVSGLAPLSAGVFELTAGALTPLPPFARGTWDLVAVETGLWVLEEKALHFTDGSNVETFVSPSL